ncbi:copia protein [Cucumis melo var. makuwa]|uniref:Copia protein n=1 Tax=Cucumis melo var. makuwa TaxID=1194695 RepID=A0A5A7V914_CUCMM|nr:copia protein [Cucumis melo var. makuwa]
MTEQLFQSKLKLKHKEDSLKKAIKVEDVVVIVDMVFQRSRNRVEENANYAEKDEESDDSSLFIACKDAKTCENSAWYHDSGASNHLCGSKSMFVKLDESVGSDIVFGDATKISVKGKGKSLINLKNGKHEFISNVYDVPNMKNNILSLGKPLRERLSSWQTIKEEFSTRIIFESKETIGVYFVKEKSEVFGMFKRFKALVEKECGYYIKALRSDKGGEFTSNEFKTFCAENRIHRPMTISFTPQQNGVVERKNRTILNMARSMLKCKKMPKEFWAQAVECAAYLSNCSPTRSLWNKTPQQAWTGRNPSIGHLRVFRCMAYAHIPNQKRSKLDDKSEKYVFVGYDASSKYYKLYNPVTKKTIVSRDVVFEEEASWN